MGLTAAINRINIIMVYMASTYLLYITDGVGVVL